MRVPTLGTVMVVGLAAALMGLYGPGCASNAEDEDRNGKSPKLRGTCPPAEDDGNPCTFEGCKGSAQEHVLVPGLPCGQGGSLKCNATGQCTGCATDDQCGDPTPCASWTCNSQVCTQAFTADNTPLTQQLPGDCQERQCDGQGGEKDVPKNDDPPVVACQLIACMNGAPAMPTFEPAGTACSANGGKTCDGQGNCIECVMNADCDPPAQSYCDEVSHTCHSCTDQLKNGDETDVDCGGGDCPGCAQGKDCAQGSDCVTMYCVDGVCCDGLCDKLCAACDTLGKIGQCQHIPKYGEDTSAGNNQTCVLADGNSCSGAGACSQALNTVCMTNPDCASNACADPDNDGTKLCLKNSGDACTTPADCFNNMCTNGTCP